MVLCTEYVYATSKLFLYGHCQHIKNCCNKVDGIQLSIISHLYTWNATNCSKMAWLPFSVPHAMTFYIFYVYDTHMLYPTHIFIYMWYHLPEINFKIFRLISSFTWYYVKSLVQFNIYFHYKDNCDFWLLCHKLASKQCGAIVSAKTL